MLVVRHCTTDRVSGAGRTIESFGQRDINHC